MVITSVETVAFTKSGLRKGFNGDNLNIKGHAIPQEKADKGYQAKGTMDLPCRGLVVSSESKCAFDAAESFRDYFHNIDNAGTDAQAAVEEYVTDMNTVMSKMANAELSLALVCAYENRVVVGRSGDCHVLRFSGGELFETALSGKGYQLITNFRDGDIFVILGSEASALIDYDAVAAILDGKPALPDMIRPLYQSIVSGDKGADCTVILMKINAAESEDGEEPTLKIFAGGAATMAPAAEFGTQPALSADEFESDGRDRPDYTDDMPDVYKPSVGRRVLRVLPIAIVVLLVAAAAGLYIATKDTRGRNKGKNTTTAPAVVASEPETESYSFTDIIEVEPSIKEMTTAASSTTTTRAASTTAREAETTTRRSYSETTTARRTTTTAAPATTRPTTQPPTTQPPVTTPPTTQPPVTDPPTTPPVTDPPTTPPVTQQPGTQIFDLD